MHTKLSRKFSLIMLFMLLLFVLIPATKAKASVVKTTGYYHTRNLTEEIGENYYGDAGAVYLKKVKLSGNNLTTYGMFFYSNKKDPSGTSNVKNRYLKAKKRTFKLTKQTKCTWKCEKTNWKTKKISKKALYKKLRKMDGKWDILIRVKNKKVTSVSMEEVAR